MWAAVVVLFFVCFFFVNQGALVGLIQAWFCIAVRVLNLNLSITLVCRCVFLQLISKAFPCISALIMCYYLAFHSTAPLLLFSLEV